jgi:hypothetical protein
MNFAAIGRTAILLESIRQAVAAGHVCKLIISASESPESTITAIAFEQLAQDIGAVYLNTQHLNSEATHNVIRASGAQVAISKGRG